MPSAEILPASRGPAAAFTFTRLPPLLTPLRDLIGCAHLSRPQLVRDPQQAR